MSLLKSLGIIAASSFLFSTVNAGERAASTSINIISAEDIAEIKPKSVSDILSTQPGVVVQQLGPNGDVNISLRGMQFTQTALIIDGVKVKYTGQQFLDKIPPESIESIKVVKGPQAVAYGSSAQGGAIVITTKRASKEEIYGSLTLESGSDELFRQNANIGLKEGDFDLFLNIGHVEQNSKTQLTGDSEGDDYRNRNLSFAAGYQISENVRFEVNGLFIDADSEGDDSGYLDLIEPRTAGFTLDGDEVIMRHNLVNTALKMTDILGLGWNSNISYSYQDVSSLVDDYFKGGVQSINWDNTVSWEKHLFSFGFEHEWERFKYDYFDGIEKRNTQTYYIGDHIVLNGNWNLDLYLGYVVDSKSSDEWVYSIASDYTIGDTTFRAAYGRSFRNASLFELEDIFYGNDLRAEKTDSLEIGIDHKFCDDLSASISYFYSETDDPIMFDGSFNEFVQQDKSRTSGFEAQVMWQALEQLKLMASFAHYHTEVDIPRDKDARSPWIPANTIGFTAIWSPIKNLDAALDVTYYGNRKGQASGFTEDKFVLTNLSISYDITENIEIYGRIRNLLDEDYAYVTGFETNERSFLGGVTYRF